MEVNDIIEDYKIVEKLYKKNNNQYYKVKCMECGHTKEISMNNIKIQNMQHSNLNCKDDYYKLYVGKSYGDYDCIDYKLTDNGYKIILKCKICGHIKELSLCCLKPMKHSAIVCFTDYYNYYIGKQFGDFVIEKIYHRQVYSVFCKAKCLKCNTMIDINLSTLINNKIQHGKICYKFLPNDVFKTVINTRFWNMYQRCNNKRNTNYSNYGGRGIKLLYEYPVDLYYDFIDEIREYSKTHSVRNSTFDRIDVNGNYEKSNLRIACQEIQSVNTRKKEIFVISNKKDIIISDNAMRVGREFGLNGNALRNMIQQISKKSGDWILLDKTKECNIESIRTLINKYNPNIIILDTFPDIGTYNKTITK